MLYRKADVFEGLKTASCF